MKPADNREKFKELADDMEANPDSYGGPEKAVHRTGIIENLRNLEYDDFANEKFAAPKVQMIRDMTLLGRADIATRVMEGDFDQ